jgi:hypothetical protein
VSISIKNIRAAIVIGTFLDEFMLIVLLPMTLAASISSPQTLIISNVEQKMSLIENITNGVIVHCSLPTCEHVRGDWKLNHCIES